MVESAATYTSVTAPLYMYDNVAATDSIAEPDNAANATRSTKTPKFAVGCTF